jgi:hypothetical protein
MNASEREKRPHSLLRRTREVALLLALGFLFRSTGSHSLWLGTLINMVGVWWLVGVLARRSA